MENITILPDASRTLRGLAHQGYTPPIAIADIVDNSIAAGADQVKIYFSQLPDDTYRVQILDNGCGMNGAELKRAMQIGSGADMARTSLSVYGMGLKAGSLSFTDSFTVMSKNTDSEDIWAARIDMDMQEENPWSVQFGTVDGPVKVDFESRLPGPTGTAVIWERADFHDVEMDNRKMTVKAISDAQEATELYLGLVFNRFLTGRAEGYRQLRIFVNDKELQGFDPVSDEYLDKDWKPIVDNLTVKISTPDEGVVEVPYTMTTYMISDAVSKNESRLGMRDQGIFP